MARSPASRTRRAKPKRDALGRDAWLDAARAALIEEGTAGVEINKLAKRLGVTRGGFYWFFTSREQLLHDLLELWAKNGTELFERLLRIQPGDGRAEFRALLDLWVEERDYDPRWDGAVRDWARTSKDVLLTVQAVDEKRITIIEHIFLHLGYQGKEARVRARVTYYHQVGYYALGVRESHKRRLDLLPYYEAILMGDVTV